MGIIDHFTHKHAETWNISTNFGLTTYHYKCKICHENFTSGYIKKHLEEKHSELLQNAFNSPTTNPTPINQPFQPANDFVLPSHNPGINNLNVEPCCSYNSQNRWQSSDQLQMETHPITQNEAAKILLSFNNRNNTQELNDTQNASTQAQSSKSASSDLTTEQKQQQLLEEEFLESYEDDFEMSEKTKAKCKQLLQIYKNKNKDSENAKGDDNQTLSNNQQNSEQAPQPKRKKLTTNVAWSSSGKTKQKNNWHSK